MTWRSTILSPSSISPFSLCFVSCNKQPPLPPNLNTIQPLTTNMATTTLSLSASMFWFKFYWGFSTLSKQIYPFLFELNFKMLIFLHIFCSICILFECLLVYLFYSFFSYKFVVWIYDLYMLGFLLDFIKLYLFINWWNLCQMFYLGVLRWNK
jgi:hypothetical protein